MRQILVIDWDGKKVGSWMYNNLKEFKQAIKDGNYDTVKEYQVFEVKAGKTLSILRKHLKTQENQNA